MYRTRTIFYINVGNLPKAKALEYVKELKAEFLATTDQIPGDQVLYCPTRTGEDRVEMIRYD